MGHKDQLPRNRLAGDQHIVWADRGSSRGEKRPDPAGLARILPVEFDNWKLQCVDERNAAAVFVALPTASTDVAGYYSLSALSVPLSDLPATAAKKLPRYPNVPATLLGRLAVDRRYQGQGLGVFLLLDALARALRATSAVGSVAVVVDAIDEPARAFYEYCQFIPLPDQRLRLFLPMKSIAKMIGGRRR